MFTICEPDVRGTPHGPKTKNATENLKNLIARQKTRTITRGPKSYLSAHRNPKEKKEFDNATETLTLFKCQKHFSTYANWRHNIK